MSAPVRDGDLAERVSEVAASIAEAIEEHRLDDIPDEALGLLFASAIKAYAEKAQNGLPPPPFARNAGVTELDVKIGSLAMLESLGLNVFELGLWQSWSNIGSRKRREPATE